MPTKGSREARERTWGRRFFALVLGIWIAAILIFGATTVSWTPVSIAQFAFMVVFLFSFAFVFSKRILSMVLPPFRLPVLAKLSRSPRVAVLYTTMNDVVPDCARAIRQTYPVDLYFLDDSSDPYKRQVVDGLARQMGARVVRRPERKGFKAGAINNWLRLHGAAYDYFVLLDADSLLPPDWVENALRYAEHPENADLAIFQGMINIWNTDVKFAGTLAANHILSHDEWERKLAGYMGAVVCYGHNMMVRTAPVREIGGFIEGYVSEDFATAVALASKGHGSTFVPLHSWEAMPENVRGFVRRQAKWTRGSMEFFSFVPPAKIPAHKKVVLLTIPWGHVAYVAIMAAIVLAVFGRYSSIGAFFAFGQNLLTAPLAYVWSISLFRFIIVMTLVTSGVTLAKLLQVRLPLWDFYRARVLGKAIGSIMLPYEVYAIAYYLIDRTRKFPVTPKDEPPMTMREILGVGRWTLVTVVLLTIGLIAINPVGLYYNIPLLFAFYTAPGVIHHYCGPQTRSKTMADGGTRDLLADPRIRTSTDLHKNAWA